MDQDNRDSKPNLDTQSLLCASVSSFTAKTRKRWEGWASSPGGYSRAGSWEWVLVTLLSKTWGT